MKTALAVIFGALLGAIASRSATEKEWVPVVCAAASVVMFLVFVWLYA